MKLDLSIQYEALRYWNYKICSSFFVQLLNLQSIIPHQLLHNKSMKRKKTTKYQYIDLFSIRKSYNLKFFIRLDETVFIMQWGFILLESNDQDFKYNKWISSPRKFPLCITDLLPNLLASSIIFFKSHNNVEFGHSELWRCQS